MDGQATIDLERPRSIPRLLGATVELYIRVPILFLALAAVVVVPYALLILLVTGNGPLTAGSHGLVITAVITLADSFLVTPLISALHVQAVREVGDGGRPRIISTFRRSISTLPVVALATGLSWIGILLGTIALIVPGLMLWARWAVVAQTASLDGGGWTDALRRSADLTDGYRRHAIGLIALLGVISFIPTLALGAAFGHETTTVASFTSYTALQIVLRSFEALATAVLYFDLKSRARAVATAPAEPVATATAVDDRVPGWYIDPSNPRRMRYWAADGKPGWSKRTARTPKTMLREWQHQHAGEAISTATATEAITAHSLDPSVHTDEDRPPGWYVDPDRPWLMRYWHAGEHRTWSKETAKTPEKAQAEWRDLRWRR